MQELIWGSNFSLE